MAESPGSRIVPGAAGFLVVGLGNPGAQYEMTYHNLGFLAVDRLAVRNNIRVFRTDCRALVGGGRIADRPVLLAKPQTFMNLSGQSVKGLVEKNGFPAGQVIVAYDDLDLPWASLRVRPNGSAGGHHGVEDIIRCLGSQDFPRVRIGIDPGHPVRDGAKFVLASFPSGQKKELDEILDHAAGAIETIIAEGVEKSMTKFNRRAAGTE
jgi:PTH1 family peptidyl-tRNA hydrolase